MQTRRRDIFTTVRTEGGILPADLLARLAAPKPALDGLKPQDYHLQPGEKINECISQSWNKLRGYWETFRAVSEKLPEGDPGTSATRERWLLPLFNELGYGRLQTAKAVEIGERSYAVSHLWRNTPIHLVGFRVELDKRFPGVKGAANVTPHGLTQELLNRADTYLWAFVSNGYRLRILRDNKTLTRQSYVEFDLQAMMEGEVYADFALLWLLCHESRVEAEKPTDCWLERWMQAAQEQGTRALDQLRGGVEEAIAALGRGFLSHPANTELKTALRSGTLDAQEYYRQLLRIVYRLLFLFVAEDRDLLLAPDAEPKARARYLNYYATTRLRRLAAKQRGTRHADLYEGLRLVMQKLGERDGCPLLGLPALGSFLFSPRAIADLEGCAIANSDLLSAIRALAYTTDKNVRRPVDYKNLRSEELGSVYEALLELHPNVNVDAGTFSLDTAGGSERKTTGSYYTPDSLVQCLLDSALDPVLEEAVSNRGNGELGVGSNRRNGELGVGSSRGNGELGVGSSGTTPHSLLPTPYSPLSTPEQRILNLKVCDPACGSGHFLIAAAHRIAKKLAYVRTGDEEPAPEAVRRALRDVIGCCLYGVDANQMAVELCKVALWMEALEPGKPLSFLDSHILHGNSLLGTTPALMADGIPEDAFKPIGDDLSDVCAELRKRNKSEREGSLSLFDADALRGPQEKLDREAARIAAIPDADFAGVKRREDAYIALTQSPEYAALRLDADAWCSAFVWKKRKSSVGAEPITANTFRKIVEKPDIAPAEMRNEIKRLTAQYGFFHWHIAFPDVFKGETEGSGEWGVGSGEWGIVTLLPTLYSLLPQSSRRLAAMRVESYRDLKVWQEGMTIAEACYLLTRQYPKEELFGMTSQIRRAASSVPANIAEGYGREGTKEYIRFLQIAQGSLKELETHLLLSSRVNLCTAEQIAPLLQQTEQLGRMLRGLIRTLQQKIRE